MQPQLYYYKTLVLPVADFNRYGKPFVFEAIYVFDIVYAAILHTLERISKIYNMDRKSRVSIQIELFYSMQLKSDCRVNLTRGIWMQ